MPEESFRGSANAVLGTNTSLIEASRLLTCGEAEGQAGWYRAPKQRAVHRILEFCRIAEAVVLDDAIFVLPSRRPADYQSLTLLLALEKEGVVRYFNDPKLEAEAPARTYRILGHLGNDTIYNCSLSTHTGAHRVDLAEPDLVLKEIAANSDRPIPSEGKDRCCAGSVRARGPWRRS